MCKLARHPMANWSWGACGGQRRDTPATSSGGLEGSAGWSHMAGAVDGRAVAGTMAGLCGGTAWHSSVPFGTAGHSWAQFGTAPCASSQAQPRAAAPEGNTAVCPLSPQVTGQLRWVDRGGLVPQCHQPQWWVLGGLCSRLCSRQCWSEEAVAGGGWELLAPSLGNRVGPAGSCLLEPAGKGWPVPLATDVK